MASSAIIRNWPKPAPRPSECASQARPRPAARPPSIAPQGFVAGAAAAGGDVAGLAAFWAGAPRPGGGGAASRRVTLPDCLHMDLPPPSRLASASACASTSSATNTTDHSFIMSFLHHVNTCHLSRNRSIGSPTGSTFDADMQGHDAPCHIVIVHMSEAALLHQPLERLLPRVHADRLRHATLTRL